MINMKRVAFFGLGLVLTMASANAFARGGSGGWSMGANIGLVNAGQDDMDKVIAGSSGSGEMGNGLEVNGSLGYSFGDVEFVVRPGYYWVTKDAGSGNDFSISAITLMPMLRFNLLSNNTIKFYAQLGLGYTMMMGEIKEPTGSAEFSGNQLGYSGGLGSEFCFIASHCFYVEANLRIASVDRMKVDKTTGTLNSTVTQHGKGQELEINGSDFSASLSGIQGVIGYNFHF